MRKIIENHIEIANLILNDKKMLLEIISVAKKIINSFQNNGKLFLIGNGGSAADSQHIAAELVGKFQKERKALNAEALTTNTSNLTALGNDYDFNYIYARQVEAKVNKSDILIGLTTSGNSKNIIEAFKKAKEIGAITIAFTGNKQNMLISEYSDIILKVPSDITARIQEMHIMIGHIICELIENNIYN